MRKERSHEKGAKQGFYSQTFHYHLVIAKNVKRWNQLWKDNQQQVGKSWKKFTSGDQIETSNYANFIKHLFNNISYKFHRNRYDARNYFKQAEAIKTMNKFANFYFEEVENRTDVDFNVKSQQRLSKNQVFKIFEYYLHDDANLTIKTGEENSLYGSQMGQKPTKMQTEKEKKQSRLRKQMVRTIEDYQKLINKCEDDKQMGILKTTLKTLNEQLDRLDSQIAKSYTDHGQFDLQLHRIDTEIKSIEKKIIEKRRKH